jgi:endonuclease-3 related protein
MHLTARQAETTTGGVLGQFYRTLLQSFGPQGWWPARTRLEIILGAILTQNTTWRNATLALKNLRKAGLLTWRALRQASLKELESCVRPAGFYRQKAQTIHYFADWLERALDGSLDALFSMPPARTREQLLSVKGIGPETADAILLYAGRQPVFVSDAYTRRVLSRHQFLPAAGTYESAQQFLHHHLPADQAMFNEFHALLVEVAKRFCRREVARCEDCPLGSFLPQRDTRSLPRAASAFPARQVAMTNESA